MSETRLIDTTTPAAEIDAWIRPAFAAVESDDLRLNNRDALGSDDVPLLSMTEQAHGENYRRMYGEWGVTREIRWADREGDPLGSVVVDSHVMSLGEYVNAFVARHGPVKLTLSQALHNRVAASRGGEN